MRFENDNQEQTHRRLGKYLDELFDEPYLDEEITDIRNVEIVFKNGIGYAARALIDSMKGLVGK